MSQGTRSMKSGASGYSAAMSGANKTYAEKKGVALAAKNTAVLSYDELERIKSMCSQTSTGEDYQSMKITERQTLQEKSAARVSKWPNTVTAMRERKEADRIKVLETEEVSSKSISLSF